MAAMERPCGHWRQRAMPLFLSVAQRRAWFVAGIHGVVSGFGVYGAIRKTFAHLCSVTTARSASAAPLTAQSEFGTLACGDAFMSSKFTTILFGHLQQLAAPAATAWVPKAAELVECSLRSSAVAAMGFYSRMTCA